MTTPDFPPAPKKPNFLCVGIEKCGSTSLYDLLKQNPAIGLPDNKELHFFNTHWDKGVHWYEKKFSNLPDTCKAIGEITPSYHRFPEVIPRIKNTLGDEVKIIFMLREPYRRAFSHYLHDFTNTLKRPSGVFKIYARTSPYAPVVDAYQKAFGKDNCLVLIFEEDFLPDQQVAMDKVCQFLGIGSMRVKPIHSNISYLPRLCQSPPYASYLELDGKRIRVAANTAVVYSHALKSTRILADYTAGQLHALQQDFDNITASIPALNISIAAKKKGLPDILALEKIIGRDLSCWKNHREDFVARIAPEPSFIPEPTPAPGGD